ncbi:HEAT repeat domain-containing protein [Bradyrhizobium sp.]|uniref:HEAT repeat domain-containing protein n=1 Tax=Bradyrhizobium sp. TaxID=376 RepID=UPI0025BDF7C5|nr:HEAT repeat domain-containing protein [Bradyrhizobium sp.]
MPLVRKPSSPTGAPVPDGRQLSEIFATGSDDDRWTAARGAADSPDGLSLLADALSRERIPRVREAIFTALTKIATPDSAAVVLPYLRSDDAAERTGALDALRAMPAAAAKFLPSLLNDTDPDVRLLACEIARVLPAGDGSCALGELIERETNSNVCSAAVEVLAETGDLASLPILARCAARFPDDPFLTFAIRAASDRIGSSD